MNEPRTRLQVVFADLRRAVDDVIRARHGESTLTYDFVLRPDQNPVLRAGATVVNARRKAL